MDQARFKIILLICWHIRVKGFSLGDYGFLFWALHKSENTVNNQKKKKNRHVFRNKMKNEIKQMMYEQNPSEYS